MVKTRLYLLVSLLVLANSGVAQEFGQDSLSDPKIEQAKGMVQTMSYYFNLIGGNGTSLSEKETIINNSYLKLFANEKVQVEDDLQEERSTVIYKDIQAYLKDIDFFFEDAYFEFEIDTVQKLYKADSSVYYQVDLIRNLEATSISGDSINSTKKRYVELNADRNGDLKIVSVYTNKISKEKQLREWWSTLTLAWKKVFQERIGVFYDSLSSDELFEVVTLDSLNISGNDLILDLEPIYQLTSLKHLKISNTWVNDLRPLLSINKLQTLDISNTSVYDLQFLKYHKDIRGLNLSNSHVEDFSVLKNFERLSKLNINGVSGLDISFINDLKNLEVLSIEDGKGLDWLNFSELTKLKELNLKNSDLITLNGISGLKNLQSLDVSGSQITSLSGFGELTDLTTLRLDNTEVAELAPITGLKNLQRVYANGTAITDEEIQQFTSQNSALLITNADQLMSWWSGLPSGLKTRLSEVMKTTAPEVEDLSSLIRIDSLDASKTGIKSLDPILKFQSLKYLNLNGNRIQTLNAAGLSSKLVLISLNDTDVSQLTAMNALGQLESFSATETAINSLSAFENLPKIRLIDVDGANVDAEEVRAILKKKPQLKVRFKSAELESWWAGLPVGIKRAFGENMSLSGQPDSDELHQLIALESLSFNGISLTDSFKESLEPFYRLTKLSFQQVRTSAISALPEIDELLSLELIQMPIEDLTGLKVKYPKLKRLNINNTAVEDLRPLEGLTTLEYLNCSGTNVKRFKGLESMINLKEIDCSNTKVFRLDRLSDLKNLEKIICFNTGLRQNDIDKLKESLPDVEIVYY